MRHSPELEHPTHKIFMAPAPRVSAKSPAVAPSRASAKSPMLLYRQRRLSVEGEQDMTSEMTMQDFQSFANKLESLFPRAVPELVFIEHASHVLDNHNFTRENSINLVSTCRDEMCRPFTELLDEKYGHHFNISSLGGMVFCGKTGFKAAMAHSPLENGKERYVFWVAPHMALSATGKCGECFRTGREQASSACGALLGLLSELKSGKMTLDLNPRDYEMSLLKQQIVSHLSYGTVPTLTQLTYAAYQCIVEEVKRTAETAVDPSMCEYVIIAGVQIHGPGEQNYFWPGKFVKIVDGVETDLYEEYAVDVASWSLDGVGWQNCSALSVLQQRRREARLAAKHGDLKTLKKTCTDLPSATDSQLRNLLHIAAIYDQLEVAQYMAELAPELVNKKDTKRKKPIDYAVESKHDKVAEFLHSIGGGMDGEVFNIHLVNAVQTLDVGMLARLSKFARNPAEAAEVTDVDGRSLLDIFKSVKTTDEARRKEFAAAMEKFLNVQGENVDKTPFDHAVQGLHDQIAGFFLSLGGGGGGRDGEAVRAQLLSAVETFDVKTLTPKSNPIDQMAPQPPKLSERERSRGQLLAVPEN